MNMVLYTKMNHVTATISSMEIVFLSCIRSFSICVFSGDTSDVLSKLKDFHIRPYSNFLSMKNKQ